MTTTTKEIKVLIVDDSAVVRKVLSAQLAEHPYIKVVGTAPDPYIARDKIVALQPDVITLDVEMPRMDGITFLHKLMKYHPMPVIVLSSLTPKGSKLAIEALASGAIEVISKPGTSFSVANVCDTLVEKITSAANACVQATGHAAGAATSAAKKYHLSRTTNKIFVIGASTGGVQALSCLLPMLPHDAPGTAVVQHMPAKFTTSFAERLNEQCSVTVKEAQNGDHLTPGQVLIAPGGFHMLLQRSGANYYVAVKDGPPVCRQKPSVEVLFKSAAKYAGPNAIGAILTGMGDDGANGLLEMKQNGAHTIAQNEETCVVFGMPKAAIECDAAEKIVPLPKIVDTLLVFSQD